MTSDSANSWSDEGDDFPYRAISKLAIAAVVLFFIGLMGLIPTFEPMLALGLIGIVCGFLAYQTITKYPNEYSGKLLALIMIALNGLLIVGGITEHTVIYLTEVPDGYERVQFWRLEKKTGADAPTKRAEEVNGNDIFIKGYIHPASGNGALSRFILVPDLGTCCFGDSATRSSSMIEVTLTGTKKVKYNMNRLNLAGRFEVNPRKVPGVELTNPVFYRLTANYVKQ